MLIESHHLAINIAQFNLEKAVQTGDMEKIKQAGLQIAAFAALEQARVDIFNQYGVDDISNDELKTYKYTPRGKRRPPVVQRGVNTVDTLTTQDLVGLEPKTFTRLIREHAGTSQQEFAAMWKPPVDKSLIARIESGSRRLSISLLHAMGRGLGWSEDDKRFEVLKENLINFQKN